MLLKGLGAGGFIPLKQQGGFINRSKMHDVEGLSGSSQKAMFEAIFQKKTCKNSELVFLISHAIYFGSDVYLQDLRKIPKTTKGK